MTEVVQAADLAGRVKRSKASAASDGFDFHCRARQLPEFEREFRFAQTLQRQWRFDFAFVVQRIAVEIEGLVVRRIGGQLVTMGRHADINGFREDCRKYAAAAELGWTVLRFEQSMVKSGEAVDTAMRVLHARGWRPTI